MRCNTFFFKIMYVLVSDYLCCKFTKKKHFLLNIDFFCYFCTLKNILFIMRNSNYTKGLCIALVMLFSGLGVRAQQFETSVYLNGILPVGQFRHAYEYNPLGSFVPMNRTTIATSAAAGLGVQGRFGMWFDVGFGQLLPYAEVGFLWNSTRSSIRNVYDDNDLNDSARATPVAPNYFNIPIMLGLKYRYDITPIIRPFAEFGIGYDLMIISSNGFRTNTEIKDMWYSYKPDGKLCWSIGAGTYLGEYVSVGLYYVGLGNHRIEYTSKVNVPDDGDYSAQRRNVGQLGLRVGFHF